MFQDVTQITIIPLYDSDSRCRDFYASHADLKTQFIADFVPKKQNIKMSVIDVTGDSLETCPSDPLTAQEVMAILSLSREGG